MESEPLMSTPPRRSRRLRWIVSGSIGVVLFLVLSGLLARFLSVENLERDMDLELVQAEARGDLAGVIDKLSGCRANAACVAAVKRVEAIPRVRRHGAVKILNLESRTAYSLTGATGRTRVAWTVLGTLPVVQCIEVRRSGNLFSGVKVSLLALSAPIPNEGDC